MTEEISWHQIVEWYQYYEVSPFGEERADLRSAMAGSVIANEIRAIAGGLAGKNVDAIQIKDLMIDTSTRRRSSGKSDQAKARAYYRIWEASIRAQLAAAEKNGTSIH